MPLVSRIDGHTLSWVKSEIDTTMNNARQALEAYVEAPDDESQLRFCLNYLHQVYGTLQMVELYGAGMLAAELEALTAALINNEVKNRNDAYEVMMRGMMQLPDYLEKLQQGQQDYPIILLPLLNDLRAARSAALMSESALFSPDLDVDAPIPLESAEDSIDTLTRKFRHAYHLGLLDWFRDTDIKTGLKRISSVIDRLRPAANDPETSRMLWAASGVIEALREQGIQSSIAVKLLMGQLDRQFKKIIDEGEFALSTEPPKDLLKNLLYYVASSRSNGKLVSELKNAFHLAEVMPDTETLERARADLSAPNAALMRTVTSVLLEDLTQVKDNLDVFVRSDNRDPQMLTALCDKLNQMGDTLDMLGFGDQRMLLRDQIQILSSMANGERTMDDAVLMDVASALLSIENVLLEPTRAPVEEVSEEEVSPDDSIIRQFADPEQRKLVKRVIDEVKVDLNAIKEAFNDFSRTPKNFAILNDAPSLLDRIRGSMLMLTLHRAADILQGAANYITVNILHPAARPETRTLDLLADAISSVEYYLESLTESWGHPTAILDVAENSLKELGVIPGQAVKLEEVKTTALEDDKTLVDVVAPTFDEQDTDAGPESTAELSVAGIDFDADQDLSMELSLEGFDDEEQALTAESIQQPDFSQLSPRTDTAISQEFDLPGVEHVEEPEEEVSVPVAPTPKPVASKPEPIKPAAVSTGSLADELDDEIVEIFLEEAEEEFANSSRLLPRWQNNPADEEALKEMRRSFHTLKGSGRLVGAVDVGEFAWSYENVLNRVIDKTIEPSQQLYDMLERGRKTLPSLLQQFRNSEKPGADVFALMAGAEALSRGEDIELKPVAPTARENEAAEISMHEEASIPDLQELEGESIELSSEGMELQLDDSDVPGFAFTTDDEEINLDSVLIPEEQAPREEAAPMEIEGLEIEGLDDSLSETDSGDDVTLIFGQPSHTPVIDPVLLGIYRKEIATHLQGLREYIADWRSGDTRASSNNLIRALHTLKGSSRTASVPQIAELCNFLEEHAKYLQDNSLEVEPGMVELLEDCGTFIEETVALLDKADAAFPSNTGLIKRTRDLLNKTRYESPTMQFELPDDSLEQADLGMSEKGDIEIVVETPAAEVIGGEITEGEAAEESAAMKAAMADLAAEYDDELLEIFLEEGVEILDESDHTLHDWIESPENMDLVKALQRQLHTLKGGARMAGVAEIGDLSHSIETMLTAIADNHLDVAEEMFHALQKAQDRLVAMLETIRKQQHPQPATDLINVINALAKGQRIDDTVLQDIEDTAAEDASDALTMEMEHGISLESSDSLELTQPEEESEPELSFDPFAHIETAPEPASNVVPLSSKQSLAEAQPADLEETEAPQKQQAQSRGRGELIRVRADLLDNLVNFAGEVSIYRSRMEQQTNAFRYNLTELDDTVERFREQLRKFEIEAEAQIQYRIEESGSTHQDFDPLEFDRFTQMQTLSRGMLESLNDLNSLRSILANLTRESETLLLQQSRVNTELQEGLMRTRMVPISGQIPRLRRIVRQTSEELGKKVELHIQGAENELDRTVLERVMSPIEHMLRNAIAHGIEMPNVRKKNGKDETGNIVLSFAREGSDVVITVSDDGAGINLDAIKAKAIARGIIKPNANVRKEDLIDMILESGFSTADQVTQISGRGVGMDVVNSEVKQLGGLLDIKSESGKGTVFQINMPLSLSVTRALMVIIGETQYAIPLLGVETVERVSRDEVIRMQSEKNGTYHWLENDYQYIHLGSAIGMTELVAPSEETTKLPLLLVRSGEYRAAIHVDGLIGSREIVVKPVGPQLSTLRGISGATVMGDGSVVLILDLGVLIRLAGVALEEAFAGIAAAEEEAVVAPVIEEKRAPIIMVVDDSITVRKVTTRLLERNNFRTVSAKDGVDALTQLQEVRPDVMLLDVEMPRMDGFELATNIRNDEVLKELPIIMITSRTGQKHRDRAMNIGVNIYMGKPYSEVELLENINAMLNKQG